jgi:hypothetical protein
MIRVIKPTEHKAELRAVRAGVKSLLCQIVANLATVDVKPMTVRVHDDVHQVTVQIEPAGTERPEEALSGNYFSPIAAAIIHAIGRTGKLVGKQIAAAIGQKYTPRLKILLNNLVDREVLDHPKGDVRGYCWHRAYARGDRHSGSRNGTSRNGHASAAK